MRKIYPHGDYRRYVAKHPDERCRCDLCKAAHRERMAAYRRAKAYGHWQAAHVDATGTHRRIRALMAIGHRLRDIAAELGRSYDAVDKWLLAGSVHRDTARAVADLYERRSGTPGPHKGRRTRSRRRGYAPPLAWDDVDIDDPDATPNLGGVDDDLVDEVALQQALAGTLPYRRLRPAERVEAYRRLVDEGAGSAVIRRRLNINGFTLQRLIELAAATEQDTEQAVAA